MNFVILNYLSYGLWNTLDICFIIRYMNQLYGRPKSTKTLTVTATFIVLFTTISMQPDKNYNNLFAITFMSQLLLLFYSQSVRKKTLFCIVLLTITGFWSASSFFFASIMLGAGWSSGLLNLFVAHIVFWLLLELAPKLNKDNQQVLPYRIWGILLSIPIMSIGVFFCIQGMVFSSSMPYRQVAALGLFVSLIILYINIMIFFLAERFSAFTTTATDNALMKQRIELQSEHFKELNHAQQRILGVRHDMKNHLQAAYYLVEQDKAGELKEYLSSLADEVGKTETIVTTGNIAIDSVLNMKLSEIRSHGIHVQSAVTVPKELKLSLEQSVILFGNILDNAKEACMMLSDEEMWIRLHISYSARMLYVSLLNPVVSGGSSGNLTTTKNDKLLHGLGLKNVQKVLDSFDGTMNTEFVDETFQIKLILYNV